MQGGVFFPLGPYMVCLFFIFYFSHTNAAKAMWRGTKMRLQPLSISKSDPDEHDFPLPRGNLYLLWFRRKCKNRGFEFLAFGEVTELRHGSELLAPDLGPVIWLPNVSRLCLVGVASSSRCTCLPVKVGDRVEFSEIGVVEYAFQ